jgi:hypothetical protein
MSNKSLLSSVIPSLIPGPILGLVLGISVQFLNLDGALAQNYPVNNANGSYGPYAGPIAQTAPFSGMPQSQVPAAMPTTPAPQNQIPVLAPGGYAGPNPYSYWGGNVPGYSGKQGLLPKFTPAFWQGGVTSNNVVYNAYAQLTANTILTGILEQDISSKTSKVGEVLSIRIDNGYSQNGQTVIPPQSKILGSILSVSSARSKHSGMPGEVQISLQTLMFPDGRTVPVIATIEHNPAMDMKNNPKKGDVGRDLTQYGKSWVHSVLNFGSAITSHVGIPMTTWIRPDAGQDFKLAKGEAIAIRLPNGLDLSSIASAPSINPSPGLNPVSNYPGQSMPPLAPSVVPGLVPDPNAIFNASIGSSQNSQAAVPNGF